MFLRRLYRTAYLGYLLRGQGSYPFKPLSAIKADQARRVRSIVAYAYRHVPYYRETMDRLGLSAGGFQSAEDLAKLPLLRREELQRDPEYFVSRAQPLDRYLRVRSSGTTGRPCTYYFDVAGACEAAVQGERARAVLAPLLGKPRAYRQTWITLPGGSSTRGALFLREHTLLPLGLRPRQQLSAFDPVDENIRLINDFKPDVVHSLGSYLTMLFARLHATGETFHRPKAVRYTSDALPQSARHLMASEFNVPAFGVYEAVEVPNIAFECAQHTGLHVNLDSCVVRIVDGEGRTLSDGSTGEVVVSNLVNRATLLLNYELGDLAALLPNRCSCGRSLPLLSYVQGRSDDWLESADGQLVNPYVVETFRYEDDIWQWQAAQESRTHFTVRLVPSPVCDRQDTERRIVDDFRRTFGYDITVDLRFVDSVERTASGKVRRVISMCSKPSSDLPPRGPIQASHKSTGGPR